MKKFNQQINGQFSSKKTSNAWAAKFNIKFIDYNGFKSLDYFNNVQISMEDFMNRAACSTVEKPAIQSRREASKVLRRINKNV